MFIINPTQEDLDGWYKCNKKTCEYLKYKKHLYPISSFGDNYYFAKTEELDLAIKDMPFWLMIFNKIMDK